MPKPRTGRPPGRPRGERVLSDHAYIRMTADERALLEKAVKIQQEKTLGARVTVSSFLLDAGKKAAEKIVGGEK